jgi:hypothetical protein
MNSTPNFPTRTEILSWEQPLPLTNIDELSQETVAAYTVQNILTISTDLFTHDVMVVRDWAMRCLAYIIGPAWFGYQYSLNKESVHLFAFAPNKESKYDN